MSFPLHIVDAFAAEPYRGNPAAICLLDAFLPDALMQNIAMEMNLAETAFLVKRSAKEYDLRWFTPLVEVNLCGHATLAAAHTLKEMGHAAKGDTLSFHTLSGVLKARVLEGAIELDFPALPGVAAIPHPAIKALGVTVKACEKNRDNYLVEVDSFEELMACAPDFRALTKLDMQGVIVTAQGADGFDFASRYFAPAAGIDEDPVTGSAHCFLAPYWAEKLGKTEFAALQASKRRGELKVKIAGERVLMQGTAFTTLKGTLQLPVSSAKEKAA